MLPVKKSLPGDQQQLLAFYSSLSPEKQQQLLEFAEFLTQRDSPKAAVNEIPQEVVDLPRPEEETVIAAMRRLRATYPALDTDGLLDQASILMSAHVLQGQSAVQVIDKLEILFKEAHSGQEPG